MSRPPLLSFSEAETVGAQLHDRWEAMTGTAPLNRDDCAWGDVVQFIMRKAADAVNAREADR